MHSTVELREALMPRAFKADMIFFQLYTPDQEFYTSKLRSLRHFQCRISNLGCHLARGIKDHDACVGLVVVGPVHCVEPLLTRGVPEVDQYVSLCHFGTVPVSEIIFSTKKIVTHLYSVRAYVDSC